MPGMEAAKNSAKNSVRGDATNNGPLQKKRRRRPRQEKTTTPLLPLATAQAAQDTTFRFAIQQTLAAHADEHGSYVTNTELLNLLVRKFINKQRSEWQRASEDFAQQLDRLASQLQLSAAANNSNAGEASSSSRAARRSSFSPHGVQQREFGAEIDRRFTLALEQQRVEARTSTSEKIDQLLVLQKSKKLHLLEQQQTSYMREKTANDLKSSELYEKLVKLRGGPEVHAKAVHEAYAEFERRKAELLADPIKNIVEPICNYNSETTASSSSSTHPLEQIVNNVMQGILPPFIIRLER